MHALLLAGWLLAGGIPSDTTVAVQRGDRVVIENLAGSVRVRAWDRAELSLRGMGERVAALGVRRDASRLVVTASDARRRGRDVDVEIQLPSWVALEIRGRDLEVDVTGTASDLQVHTVEGDVRARDVGGVVTLTTVDGTIDVDGATGKITARSRGDDVTLRRVRGELQAYSGSGDVLLEQIQASSVTAETLDGDLTFRGAFTRAGRYAFSTHDGDALIEIPPDSGVRARISTFDGEFTSDFPVTLEGYGGRGVFEFVLGGGEASLEIKVFDGEIRLVSGRR